MKIVNCSVQTPLQKYTLEIVFRIFFSASTLNLEIVSLSNYFCIFFFSPNEWTIWDFVLFNEFDRNREYEFSNLTVEFGNWQLAELQSINNKKNISIDNIIHFWKILGITVGQFKDKTFSFWYSGNVELGLLVEECKME